MSNRKIFGIVLAVLLIVGALFAVNNITYHQNASQIAVVQSPLSGDLTVSFDPGQHYLGGGHVTMYPRRGQIDFDGDDQADRGDGVLHIPQLDIRFNDGAKASIKGSLAWEMPTTAAQVISLHKLYGSPSAIESQIIVKNIGKAVSMTGPLMSSAESYATRRNDLLSLVYDQIQAGAYKTTSRTVTVTDPLTGATRDTTVVAIAMDTKGQPLREDTSLINESGLHTFNLTLDNITYPDVVESQIANQQQAIMAVQTAIAKAKTAEQDALTIEQQGKAAAAQSKWEQEAIRAKEVTIAEKNLDVATLTAQAAQTNAVIIAEQKLQEATLAAQAAAQTKQASILLGEGQAEAATLVMQANGALEQKLAAWKEVNMAYADAIAKYQGNWVPQTVFGGSGAGSVPGGGATDLIQLLTAKTAKDIGLDMSTTASRPNKAN